MHTHPLIHVRQTILSPILIVAHQHDESAKFRFWYAIAVIVAGVVFNLGIFALLVAAHMVLDIIKYRSRHRLNWYWTLVETVRESIIDVFFIVLGLFLAFTVHHAVAIGGLGRVARAEAFVLGFILRVGPRLKIAEDLLKVIVHWKHHFMHLHLHPRKPFSRGELVVCTITVTLGIIMICLPLITPLTWETLFDIVTHELRPRLEMGITETISYVNR